MELVTIDNNILNTPQHNYFIFYEIKQKKNNVSLFYKSIIRV